MEHLGAPHRALQANRTDGTVKQCIRAYCNEPSNWDQHIPEIAFAMRTAVSAATGYTPALLCYGRELRTLWQPTEDNQDAEPAVLSSHAFAAELQSHLAEVMLGVPRGSTTISDAEPRHCRKATLSCGKPTYSVTLQEGSPRSWHQCEMAPSASADVLVQTLSSSSTRRLGELAAKPMPTNSPNTILHGERGASRFMEGTGCEDIHW
ncbi:hypothetical protein MTO96_031850 [Rhipicephalus appendiculatus]